MSKYGFLKVGAVCPKTVVADPKTNAQNALLSLSDAVSCDIGVAVFPELFLSGSTCGDLFRQTTLLNGCADALKYILNETSDMEILYVIGLPIKVGYDLFDCAAVCFKGKLLGVVPKSFIAHSGGATQKRYFSSLNDSTANTIDFLGCQVPFGKLLFNVCGDVTIGIEIGDDLNSPVSPSSLMCISGANLILNLAAHPETVTSHCSSKTHLKAHSKNNICAYVYSSAGVGESSTDGVYSGACMVYESGNILSQNDLFNFENSIVSACVDFEKINNERQSSSVFRDCSALYDEEYQIISVNIKDLEKEKVDRVYSPTPFIPSDKDELEKRCDEVFAIQTAALAKRLEHTNIKKVVVGISGGLDSTLALLVASKTFEMMNLDKKDLICITMPGFGTTDNTKNNSVTLVESLGATLKIISIKNACLVHFEDIGHNPDVLDVTYENAQARERTQILMDVANKEGALLVGTGDLSESALGWCTFNGDHMCMYNVNCDVPKTLIPCILRRIGSLCSDKTASILSDIIDTPISPELLPPDENGNIKQKTEDNIGPYELHDFFLYHFVRNGFSPERILLLASISFAGKYEEQTISKWLNVFLKRFFISQFKRSCCPDGPKVGSVDLSPRGEWQMPSDASFNAWKDTLN